MSAIRFDQLGSVLTFAIGPVVLLSGCGLLLLSLTTRLGRATDLARSMARHLNTSPPGDHEPVRRQLHMLLRRTMILRRAIALVVLSALLAAVLVVELFIAALFDVELVWATVIIFIACLVCLIAGLIEYIADVNAVLAALRIEAGKEWPEKRRRWSGQAGR